MKTLSGKEFRKLFNRYETGFYLSEFEYLKDFDPLFPECVGKELKLGYKRKVDVWCEEDAALYAEFIATKERLKKRPVNPKNKPSVVACISCLYLCN